MMSAKSLTLPADFERLLAERDLDVLIAVFDTCELDARGGEGRSTALGFPDCPDDLARWLVGQGLDIETPDSQGESPLIARLRADRDVVVLLELGADVNASDRYGFTPLHTAVRHARQLNLLIDRGAQLETKNTYGDTPLGLALRQCKGTGIPQAARSAGILVAAGATIAGWMRRKVDGVGREFEFTRALFDPSAQREIDQGLAELYAVFDVTPVPVGAPITVTASTPGARYRELWDLLVPASGPATTVQGETIRLIGRIGNEILNNGGGNWDEGFQKMNSALASFLVSGVTVTTWEEIENLYLRLRDGQFDKPAIDRLTDLAVAWVLANPHAKLLPPPTYHR